MTSFLKKILNPMPDQSQHAAQDKKYYQKFQNTQPRKRDLIEQKNKWHQGSEQET